MKKIYIKWIVVVLLLVLLLFFRILRRSYTFSKLPFSKKAITELKFNDINDKPLVIKKENNIWSISTPSKSYLPDERRLNELEEKIKNLELLEVVTKNKQQYSEYLVNDESATVVLLKFKQDKIPFNLYLGKSGGFSYSESYIRLDKDIRVYLARDLRYTDFKTDFYNFCNKTLLKSKVENINKIYIKHFNKEIYLKQNLENNTTTWINLKTSKKIENEKVDSLLRMFIDLIADIIVEEDEVKDISKLPFNIKIILEFSDSGSIEFYLYGEQKRKEIPIYVSKILYSKKSESIEFAGKEDVLYTFYKYKYDDFDKRISDLMK
ncbi:MAG: DUF4340 domain-containing protein [Endomicrobia bacterium]|nr:DUF4340 domain-containing protein [Endomicrobiia bacterium]